ncbi:MAG: fused MFS/spermidine synthase [Verrucomicrobia bacterium]|nr:fused MFS/spermidine synthase [Verrucomicrobiota bacterium]
MRTAILLRCLGMAGLAGWLGVNCTPAAIVFETTSPYHHIQVVDQAGRRTLSFDSAMETTMSLTNSLQGHFQYTEFFQMPWLWNFRMTNVLMIGLGGGSTQRAYEHYYPGVVVETVEIDPAVAQVAKKYFQMRESATQRIHLEDGRVHLRRSEKQYDAIILDAYVANRYGSFIPYHLATKEFFLLAREHLATNGVIAYNVIGTLGDWRADILGAMFKTMKAVFPQVYFFAASDSLNVVLIGTKSTEHLTAAVLEQRALALIQQRRVTLPAFLQRVRAVRTEPPPSFELSPILTDDYAPVDGLLSGINGANAR